MVFIVASVLLFIMIPLIFLGQGHVIDLTSILIIAAESDPRHPDLALYLLRMVLSYLILLYTTLFSVKLAYLLFFRPMLERLPVMIVYWRGALAFTVIACVFDISVLGAGCFHQGVYSSKPLHALFPEVQLCKEG